MTYGGYVSYETADNQLEYDIQFYQTVSNTVSRIHNTTDTTGLELDCDILQMRCNVYGIQFVLSLLYMGAVSRRM